LLSLFTSNCNLNISLLADHRERSLLLTKCGKDSRRYTGQSYD
jgi:hypothetical protein